MVSGTDIKMPVGDSKGIPIVANDTKENYKKI